MNAGRGDHARWADNITARPKQHCYTTGINGAGSEKYREAMARILPHIDEAATAAQRVRLDATWFQRTFRKKWLKRQALLACMAHLSEARSRVEPL